MNETLLCMVYLISCALHDSVPEDKYCDTIDGNALYSLAKRQRMRFIVESALENTSVFGTFDEQLQKKWKNVRTEVLRKNILCDNERNEIFEEFEKYGIRYMPLKGSVLQSMYPEYGMREYSDNDILIDDSGKNRENVRKIMSEREYTVSQYRESKHDVYHKSQLYNYEMHFSLFTDDVSPEAFRYYDNVWDRLIKDDEHSCAYHFSNEDLYIYNVAHTEHHHACTGDGIRALVDVYVMRSSLPLDDDYIKAECDKLGIADYEQSCRMLAEKLFSSAEYPAVSLFSEDEVSHMEKKSVGVFGYYSNYVDVRLNRYRDSDGKLTKLGKIRYALSRLFPSAAYFRKHCYRFGRFPFLLPFYWIYRIIRELIVHGRLIKTEIRRIIAG